MLGEKMKNTARKRVNPLVTSSENKRERSNEPTTKSRMSHIYSFITFTIDIFHGLNVCNY